MISPLLWRYCVSLCLAGTLLTSWELSASPGLGWAGVDLLLFHSTGHNPMLVISTQLTPAPTTPPPSIGLISTWKGLRAHYHSLGLIRASSPQAFYKPERMEKFSQEGRGIEKEISYRACHPGSQMLKVQIRRREEVIEGEERKVIRKAGQGRWQRGSQVQ